MENTAQSHKSCVGPSRGEDEARNSDSGDSVFFSQKPLPEAVRSGGRRLARFRSACTQEGPPELEDDIFPSSSSSDEESKTKMKKRRRRVIKGPSCRFSFLPEKKGQTNSLLRVKIKQLHSYMIGGYMKHVQELWKSYEQGEDVAASLPTVDVDEEELSPVSEEEKDEAIEDEDIKVVERKHFATSIKAKSSKPWCASKARYVRKRNLSPALNGSPGQQQKTLPEVSTSEPVLKETPSAAVQTSPDEDTVCGETESRVTSDRKTGQRRKEKNRREESRETLGPESHTQEDGDPHTEILHLDEQSRLGNFEDENGILSQSDVNDALCLKRRRKNKEGEGVEKEKKQDGTEGQHEEELLIDMKDVPESKPKKKKKPASEDGRQDDGSVEKASLTSSKTRADWKKQKKDVDVDGGRTDPAAEPPTDEAKVRKTKNKKKDPNVTSCFSESPTEHRVEDTEAPQETELSFTKIKDQKKKHSASAGEGVKLCNDAVTNTDSTSQRKKADMSDAAEEDKRKKEQAPELQAKKKKKRKKKRKSACAGDNASFCNNNATKTDLTSQQKKMVDMSDAPEEDKQKEEQAPELQAKKKKQKNNWSVATCEDTVAQVNYSALVRKKEKKATSSFLAADEEENGAEERHESSQSAAETLHVSAADLAVNSAESSERLKDETRSKKKKKKSAWQGSVGGETGFKEPKGTPEVEVKKKRKCERSDGELMSPTDLSLEESQTDADVPLKKKKKKKDEIPPAASKDDESEASTQLSSDSQKKMLKKKVEKSENKLSLAKKSSPKPAESEACKTKQTEKKDFNLGSKAPPLSLTRKNNKKRKLYHASQDILSDF